MPLPAMPELLCPPLDEAGLRALFSKPYGAPAPTPEQWRAVYADDVHFRDPTQEQQGIAAYLAAQDGLVRRCDDVSLEAASIAISGDKAFVEWVLALKIKGIEFVYPGVSRLEFATDGRIIDQVDYFDFVGPTFGPVPLLGPFVRWLYRRFVS
jgi:hypothetical protein